MKLIKHAIECLFFSLLEHEGLLHLPYIIVQLSIWLVLRKYQKYREKIIFLKASWRCLEDVFARGLEDVLKTSSEDEDERRLQGVFKTSSSRRMFGGKCCSLIYTWTYFISELHFIKKTSQLICRASQMTGFFINCNSGLKWVKRALHQWNISPALLVKD